MTDDGADATASAPCRRHRRRLRRSRRRPGGAALFTLGTAAEVTISLTRRVADKRYGPITRVKRSVLAAGSHRVSIPRRLLGRRPGAYKLTVTPAGGRSIALRFRIAKAAS
jgi:hypothetical protein